MRFVKNDCNLNIPRYFEPIIKKESMTVEEAVANPKHSLEEAYAA